MNYRASLLFAAVVVLAVARSPVRVDVASAEAPTPPTPADADFTVPVPAQSSTGSTVVPEVNPAETKPVPTAETRLPAKVRLKVTGAARDVVQMHLSGVSAEVILAYIQTSGRTFYLGADDILELTRLGVPSPFLVAMIRQGAKAAQAQAQPVLVAAPAPVADTSPPAPTPTPAPPPVSTAPVWVTGTPPPPVYVVPPTYVEPTYSYGLGLYVGYGGYYSPRWGYARYNYSFPYAPRWGWGFGCSPHYASHVTRWCPPTYAAVHRGGGFGGRPGGFHSGGYRGHH